MMSRLLLALVLAFGLSGWFVVAQTPTKVRLIAAPFKLCAQINQQEADALASLEYRDNDPRISPDGTVITTVEQWLKVHLAKQVKAWVSEGSQRFRQETAGDIESLSPADQAAILAEIAKRKRARP